MSDPTIGGYVCVRNGINLGYCFVEAIQSLLPLCDEVIACDSDSTDGTTELLLRWLEREPKLRYLNRKWEDPVNRSHDYWLEWMNFAREHLTTDYQIELDADEVLDDRPKTYEILRQAAREGKSLRVDRLNFFRDPETLLPPDKVVGKYVARFGPRSLYMPSDNPGQYQITDEAITEPRVKIFHLGFLRPKDQFYRKSQAVGRMWFGGTDQRVIEARKRGQGYSEMQHEWENEVVKYTDGHYPQSVREWLDKTGYVWP